MTYKPVQYEVFFCGQCKQQQPPSKGEPCKDCGKQTVSWYTNRESESDAIRKWKQVNGKM